MRSAEMTREFRPPQHQPRTEDVVMLLVDSTLPAMAWAFAFLVVGGIGLIVLGFIFHDVPLPDFGERGAIYASLAAVVGAGVVSWIAHVRLALAAWANRRVVLDEQGVASYSRLNRRTFIRWSEVRRLRLSEYEDSDTYSAQLALYGGGARIRVDAGEVASFGQLKDLLLERVPPERVRHDLHGDLRSRNRG